MSIVFVAIGSVVASFMTLKLSTIPIAGWVLGPIAGFFSSFLWAGWISAGISYYFLGVSESTINAGEGIFTVIFFILFIPILLAHGVIVLGSA